METVNMGKRGGWNGNEASLTERQVGEELPTTQERLMSDWIAVKDQLPDKKEPVVYARPNPRRRGTWHVGIAYWTVSQKWNPECESLHEPNGFTHWKPLGLPPTMSGVE
jgi:hypothetical protein